MKEKTMWDKHDTFSKFLYQLEECVLSFRRLDIEINN